MDGWKNHGNNECKQLHKIYSLFGHSASAHHLSANQRRRLCLIQALERQAPPPWERLFMQRFGEIVACDFTEVVELWVQHFQMKTQVLMNFEKQ